MPVTQDSRILIKRSTTAGVVPTVPVSNDHTDGSWLVTDIYKGEIFINLADAKVYTRCDSGIVQLDFSNALTLYKDGSRTMTGDLNLGNNDIKNVRLFKDGSNVTALSILSRILYDQTGTFILNFNNRSAGLGINTNTNYLYLKTTNLSGDVILEAPTTGGTIATQAYADSLVVGLWDDRGSFDASVNAYPSSGGSGSAGAIKKGDIWTVTVAGTLPTGQVVEPGDTVRALVDTPGNTQANWSILQNNIGYTPVTNARILTINGTAYDLSADRSWTVGDQLKANFQKAVEISATASGTNTYTASLSPAPASLSGVWCLITFTNANTGAATLDLNSLGAKSIVKGDGTALSSGDIPAGSVQLLNYNGTNWQVIGGSASGGSGSYLAIASNLSDLASKATARVNLGIDKRTSHGDSDYAILATDKEVVTSATLTAPRVWTLPAANSVNAGYEIIIADEFGGVSATNTITITAAGSDTINGATTEVIKTSYAARRLFSDGVSKWTFDAGILRLSSSGSIVNLIDEDQIYIQGATNKTYPLISKKIYPGTVNGVYGIKTGSGTCTVAFQINGVNITGLSAVSVTTTAQDVTASALNTMAAGDRLTIVVSSASSPVDLEGTLKVAR
jgi:hypothetical protein